MSACLYVCLHLNLSIAVLRTVCPYFFLDLTYFNLPGIQYLQTFVALCKEFVHGGGETLVVLLVHLQSLLQSENNKIN